MRVRKHIRLVIVIAILLLAVLATSLFFALGWRDGKINPNISYNSLDELQAVMSDDFYYFDCYAKTHEPNYQAVTNTYAYSSSELTVVF